MDCQRLYGLDGRLLYKITHHTPPAILTFPDAHTAELCFHLYQAPLHPLILGNPWLIDHNPHIDGPQAKSGLGEQTVSIAVSLAR